MSTRCMSPFTVKTGIHVPCGKCPACYARRASGWSFRLMQEDRYCQSAYFITLSYDDKKGSIQRSPVGRYLTSYGKHVQWFVKSVRRRNHGRNIKYFVVGEYGSKRQRPHYHMLLFNAKVETIDSCWPHGNIFYGSVSGASVGYCLKYISKPGKIPLHKNDDRVPEFMYCSKGIGSTYCEDPDIINWHKADLAGRYYLPLPGGKKISMPRYYKMKIYNDGERRYINDRLCLLDDKWYVTKSIEEDIVVVKEKTKQEQIKLRIREIHYNKGRLSAHMKMQKEYSESRMKSLIF